MSRLAITAEIAERAERARLDAVTGSYGEEIAPFDALMRGYMMRTLAPWFRDGAGLQVGCAHGDQTSLLLERFPDLTVLEPTRAFIDLTRRKVGGAVRFVEGLVETFETDARFDTILFSHVLEHVDDPRFCLRKLAGLLAPGGRLLVVVPNAEAPSRRIAVKMGVLPELEALSADDLTAGHRRVYRLETLRREIEAAGLSVAAKGGIFFKPLANFQLNALAGGPLLNDAFFEGCYLLGEEQPTACASLYAVIEADAVEAKAAGAPRTAPAAGP